MALGLAPEHPPPVQTPGPPPVPVAMQTPASMKERTLSDILDEEPDYESLPTNKLSAHLLAGGVAGMMEHCFMYPVDCIKVCVCVHPCRMYISYHRGIFLLQKPLINFLRPLCVLY